MIELHIQQLADRLTRIEEKLDRIQEFKTQTIVTARHASVIVSAILGFVSLVASGVLTYAITAKAMN